MCTVSEIDARFYVGLLAEAIDGEHVDIPRLKILGKNRHETKLLGRFKRLSFSIGGLGPLS